jgi:Ca-activated chloride channel homolog
MNAKKFFILIAAVFVLVLQACASPAAPTLIAQEPRQSEGKANPQSAGEVRPQATAAYREPAPAAPAPEGNEFQDYGVNPGVDARRDHLSTFGLDVDTASYAVTRRYIEDGRLPPYDSVRVEEFVNAFDQGYEAPYDAAFTIYADGAPAPQGFERGSVLLRFGVQGYQMPDWERKPSVLTFVIDVSGSMSMENRLELVKDSLHLLVDRLDERDSVAVVVYGTNARVVLEPTSGDRKREILNAIDRLRSEGSTNAEAGLRLGYKLAMRALRAGSNNRVILCSDGVANVGLTDADNILDEIAGYVEEGIHLTSIGVGMGNFNDVLLEQLADKGDGNYAYIDTLDEARKVFVEDLTATLQVIARDAKVQVDFNPEVVRSYRLLGYENRAVADQDFRNDSVDAGELGAGHSATALYVVQLVEGSEGRIATVQLRWQDPEKYDVREMNGNFNTWDLAGRFEDTDPRYQMTAAVAQFAEILRESPYLEELSLNDLARRAARIARQLPEDQQAAEFARLVERAAELRR